MKVDDMNSQENAPNFESRARNALSAVPGFVMGKEVRLLLIDAAIALDKILKGVSDVKEK
jgi:hypothetical protein